MSLGPRGAFFQDYVGTFYVCCLRFTGAVLSNFVMETADRTSENRLNVYPFALFIVANRAHNSTYTRMLNLQTFQGEGI